MEKNKMMWVVGVTVLVVVLVIVMITAKSSVAPTLSLENGLSTSTSTNTSPNNTPSSASNKNSVYSAPTPVTSKSPSSLVKTTLVSLRDLLASSKVEKCSFADTSAGITIGGAVSMTNGKIRSDFDASSNGTTMGTHMIALGQDVYVWTDGATTGSVSSLGVGYGPTAKPTVNGLNLDQKMAYVCTPWTVDASRFVLPSSVKFSKI